MEIDSNNQPVFLVAPVRSGSTFLRLMLDSHPNITNPGECDFLFDRIADDGSLPEVGGYLEWFRLDRSYDAYKLDVDPAMDYKGLINSFVRQFERPGKVLVMNTHRHFYHVPIIFPRAKYIHLLRDGRDVARSCINMGWFGNTYYGIDIWCEAENAWDKLKDALHPAQYMEIKYEDLLEDIELGLGNICQFLGLEYSKVMMEYASKTTYSLPDKKLSYQWKSKYKIRELSLVESKAGKMLLDRGYELSGASISGPDLAEKISLYLQNKYMRVKSQISIYGLSLFIQSYLARKLGIYSWSKSLKPRINAADIKTLK
jgi:hypothetical protein